MHDGLRDLLYRSKSTVFFGGAGVSTESGIPDFRSDTGVKTSVKEFGATPEEILSRGFFLRKPEIFFRFCREKIYLPADPNPAHIALAKLEEEGRLSAVITQNIDGLHQRAGSKNVLELHGSTQRNYCVDCGRRYSFSYITDISNCLEGSVIPRCECGGIVRPDVVLYEEALDDSVMRKSADAIGEADLLIVGGTSLVVYPAAGLLRYLRGGSLVLINLSPTPFDDMANLCIHDSIGKVMSSVVD